MDCSKDQQPSTSADDPFTRLYNRHPLVLTRHEIRLLYLTPGDGDEPIHCTLEVKALDDCPEFEALSYVWGDPFATRPITVEDATLDVTLNLYSALRRLRPKPGTARLPLWVDAVCINQRSVKEKNHQVPMMARIYRQCKDVIAWQGEPEPEVVLFLKLVVATARDQPKDSEIDDDDLKRALTPVIISGASCLGVLVQGKGMDEGPAFEGFSTNIKVLQACLAANKGYSKVQENTYWSRIWTFQEYELPAATPLCCYGDISVRWEKYECSLADKIRLCLLFLIHDVYPGLPAAVKTSHTVEMEHLVSRVMTHVGNAPRMVMTDRRNLAGKLVDYDVFFFFLMWASKDCNYTDPRDRIYALHGLLPRLATAHPPDYNRNPPTVLVEALAFYLHIDAGMLREWLDSLPLQGRRMITNGPQQYPSWMPAVGTGSKRATPPGSPLVRELPTRMGRLSDAFGAKARDLKDFLTNLSPSIVPDQHMLKAPVIRLRGTTKRLVTFAGNIEQILTHLVSLVDSLLKVQSFTSSSRLSARLVRCLSAYLLRPKENEFLVSAINAIMSNSENADASQPADLGLVQNPRLGEVLRQHCVFLVDEHMLGFGREIQDGDTICIIPGVHCPFAICKEREDPELGTVWNMAGAVYIDGLMENEGLDTVLVDEVLSTPAEMLTFQ